MFLKVPPWLLDSCEGILKQWCHSFVADHFQLMVYSAQFFHREPAGGARDADQAEVTPGLLRSAAEPPDTHSSLAAALRAPDERSWPERSAERSSFETVVEEEDGPVLTIQLDPPWLLKWNRPIAGGSNPCGGVEQTVSNWSLLVGFHMDLFWCTLVQLGSFQLTRD